MNICISPLPQKDITHAQLNYINQLTFKFTKSKLPRQILCIKKMVLVLHILELEHILGKS